MTFAGLRRSERIAEDDMLAAFLAAEVDSRRFSAPVRAVLDAAGLDDDAVRARTTDDPVTTERRRAALANYRGWERDENVFAGLPTTSIDWWRGELARSALAAVDVVKFVFELDPSLRTRHLLELRDLGRDMAEEPDIVATAAAIRRGDPIVEPILVTAPSAERLVILEGHTRLSAYARLDGEAPAWIPVIVGITPDAAEWSEW
jgi:hypothetical protein